MELRSSYIGVCRGGSESGNSNPKILPMKYDFLTALIKILKNSIKLYFDKTSKSYLINFQTYTFWALSAIVLLIGTNHAKPFWFLIHKNRKITKNGKFLIVFKKNFKTFAESEGLSTSRSHPAEPRAFPGPNLEPPKIFLRTPLSSSK